MKFLFRFAVALMLAESAQAQTVYPNVQRASATTILGNTRVPFADASGRLTDDSDMTFATDTLTVTKGTFGGITHVANAIASANSVTSVALSPLTLRTGTSGTALSFASATNIATFSAGITGTSLTLSSLTSGRVPFATTAGLLTDGVDLTFSTDTLTFTKGNAPTSMLVGIAGTPATEFETTSTSTSSPRGIMSSQYNTGTDGARFHGRKARGTRASPTIVATGDNLTRWVGSGYDGSSYLEMASIIFGTEGTIASTRVPTNIQFWTATDAAPSVLTEAARFDSAQLFRFGGSAGGYVSGSSGAIGLTAAGTNQNVTLTPSGTGLTKFVGASETSFIGALPGSVTYGAVFLGQTSATATNYILASNGAGSYINGASSSSQLVFTQAGVEKARFAGTTGNLLLGGLTTDDTVNSLQITGGQAMSGKINTYNGIATAGNGVVTVQGAGRSTAQTAAVASVATYTVGASDASFEVSANVLVTTSTTHSFTATCAYTDESNVARTLTLSFSNLAATFLSAITNVTGAGPYEGVPLHIRCKASTTITIATTGTFTSVTYNVEGNIRKLQ